MRSSCCKTRPKTNSALALAVAPGGRAVLRARPLGFYYASRTGICCWARYFFTSPTVWVP